MKIKPFRLERYFAAHEFGVEHLLSASDCESLSLKDLLSLADADALALWHDLGLGYTETQGHPLLRQEVSMLYNEIKRDDILVAAPEECIFIAMHALLREGDRVIVLSPAYQSLFEVPVALGCQVTAWPLRVEGNSWHLDTEFLRSHITPATRLVVINFPHNPTGLLPQAHELHEIVKIAREHGAYLFSDEMYWLLEYDEKMRLPAICDIYEKGISLFGMSKTFSLPGLRIGWLATQDRTILEQCCVLKDYTTICCSAPSEILAVMALRAREVIRRRNVSIIQHNLEAADRFFADHAEQFLWLRPQAGSVAFPELLLDVPVDRFCKRLREERSVLLVDGGLFEHPGRHFRLGLGRKDMPEALERVREYMAGSGLS